MSKFEGYLAEGAFCPGFAQGLTLRGKAAAAGFRWPGPARPALLGLALAVLVASLAFLTPGETAAQAACPTYTVPDGDRANRTAVSDAGPIVLPVQDLSLDCPGRYAGKSIYIYIDIGASRETYLVLAQTVVYENRADAEAGAASGNRYNAFSNVLYQGRVNPGVARPAAGCGMGGNLRLYRAMNCNIAGGSYTLYIEHSRGQTDQAGPDFRWAVTTIQTRRVIYPQLVSRSSPEPDVILELGESRVFNLSDYFSGDTSFPDSASNISILPLTVNAPGTDVVADDDAQTITLLGRSVYSGTATFQYQRLTAEWYDLMGFPNIPLSPRAPGVESWRPVWNPRALTVNFPLQIRAQALPGQEPKVTEKFFTLDSIAGWDAAAVQDAAEDWFVELAWDTVDRANGYIIEARDNGVHLRISRLTETDFAAADRVVSLPRTPGADVGATGRPLTYVVARVRAYQTQLNNEEWYSPWTEDRAVTFFDGDIPRPEGVPVTFADPLGLLSIANAVGQPLGFGDNGRGLLLVVWAVGALVAGAMAAWFAGRRAWTPAGLLVGGLVFTLLWTILGPLYGGVSIPWAIGPLIPIGILGAFALRKQAGG